MISRWAAVAIVLWVGVTALPARVEAVEYLYRVQRVVSAGISPPGTAVPGLDDVRLVTTSSQLAKLNFVERSSLQKNIQYRSLLTPNDPHFYLQWNLQTMRVPTAWDVDQFAPAYGGDSRIVVAVLDSGIASTLVGEPQSVPDIAASSIWTNSREVGGDGMDNDGNGFIDDVHGWNFVSQNARPADDNGHGTHISGVIAASINNSVATAGIAGNVTIMPLKVLDGNGLGTTATLTAAVNYAIKQGASIINLSLGGDEDDLYFHQAIQTAVAQGIVIVAAAGNSGAAEVTYPARYNEVIGVGATNTDGTRATYSNYGSALTLVAPGGDTSLDLNADGQPDGIPSQTCADSSCTTFFTIYLSGTSQAASEVSGVAALLASCGAPPGNIKSLLMQTATDLGVAGRDDIFGAGQVDAAAAMTAAGCVVGGSPTPGVITGVAARGSGVQLQAKRPSPYTKPIFSWPGHSDVNYDVTWKKGSTVVTRIVQAETEYAPVVKDEALYSISVKTIDALGQISPASTFFYRYQKPVVTVSSGSAISLLTGELKTIRSFNTTVGKSLTLGAGWIGDTWLSRLLAAPAPGGSTLSLLDTKGTVVSRLQPFGKTYFGVIAADVLTMTNGASSFVAATQTSGAAVAWYSANGKLLGRNQVFANYTKGINVATGDVDGDGNDELVVAQAAGPEIRVYSAARTRLAVFNPRGKTFTKGWSISVGDTNGDGRAEIIAMPNVAETNSKIILLNGSGRELKSFAAAGSTAGPMVIQALDMTGDGKTEILTAPKRGAGLLRVLTPSGKVWRQLSLPSSSNRGLAGL